MRAVLGSKLVALYYAVPALSLAGNLYWVARPELALPVERRTDARLTRPLARADRCVEWLGAEGPKAVRASGRIRLVVTLRNCGRHPWPDFVWAAPTNRWGVHAVRLIARWSAAGALQAGAWLGFRGELPHAVLPGDEVTLPIYVPAPEVYGRHELELDLVQELVAPFSDGGARPLRLDIDVR